MTAVAGPVAAQSLPYAIVDTGQTGCFDARGASSCPAAGAMFFGQDGQVRGNQPHYRDNGDGTVSDLVTGLMWQKGFERTSFGEAPGKAAASRVGGHADWRVPTIKELYSLIDFSGATGSSPPSSSQVPADARPYLDTRAFTFEYPRQGRFIDAQYVTSTAYTGRVMGGEAAFFGVNFADGRIKGYPQNGGPGGRQWYGRWVRGNPAYGKNDFVDNGNGTVADRATGLTWMNHDHGRLDWAGALAFCDRLDLAGQSDWRLPSAKELHSIVDYSRSPDATGSAAIDPIFAISAIAEADGSRNWPYFWSSTSHLDGRQPGDFAVYLAFGKAMGNIGMGGPQGMGGQPGMGPPGMGMGMGPPGMGPPGMGPPGMGPPGMGGPPSRASGPPRLLDVHGAGAQRSSPKSGDESRLPVGAGPQGDVLRIYNSARCVRG
ncbi:hypothetical protein A6A05_11785 [Magnetospirillum moscoviense]|uniref:Lcl C-terminal domain-containing protein n=2 Tax=Magnetospirillum moscoviense TaxID=1437059 RepID=A0A178MQ69_9PROT|nr:hypothetical protein A6A05_11785 [Magnetospirillum moscoviense]